MCSFTECKCKSCFAPSPSVASLKVAERQVSNQADLKRALSHC